MKAERVTTTSTNYDSIKTQLESVISILESNIDLSDHSSPFLHLYNKCASSLRKLCSSATDCTIPPVCTPEIVIMSGLPGRPKVHVNIEFVEMLREAGYTWIDIAKVVGTSRTTLWRRLKENGTLISQFSEVSDGALDYLVKGYQDRNPNAGEIMLRGYLLSNGIHVQRRRIRDSIARVDPLHQRIRWHQRISRRVYKVPGANSLWHIDGHHSLIQWRFVIHGGIDGFSRMVVFLKCATNNHSSTVMTEFYSATCRYGIPSRVRSDKGGENVLVCHFMISVKGVGRGSHLAGSSTRNQRIERLWRDVYRCAASTYHELFHSMEAIGVVDPDVEIDLFILHCLYLPRINNSHEEFSKAWNRHPMRTEDHWSPHKIWINSIVRGDYEEIETPDLDEFGIDEDSPVSEEQTHTVSIPDTLEDIDCEIQDQFLVRLHSMAPSVHSNETDHNTEFMQAKALILQLLQLQEVSD